MGGGLLVFIQDPSEVAEAVREMRNPNSKITRFDILVGDRGNQVVRDHLAGALAQCQIDDLDVCFEWCNLNEESVQLLADAVEQNTTLVAFTCKNNPFNFPNGEDYDPSTDEPIKQAIIHSKAPIRWWNHKELPQDMVDARKKLAEERAAAAERSLAEITQALIQLELTEMDAKQCTAALAKQGFDSLKKLTFLEESDLVECNITGFNKRVVLAVKASLAAATPPQQQSHKTLFGTLKSRGGALMFGSSSHAHAALTAPAPSSVHSTTTAAATATPHEEFDLPPLPPPTAFYAFLSHNWGNNAHNHARVRRIKDWFVQQGAPMWFDDERLTGNVASQIIKGMDSSAAVVVFITKAYLEKVDKGADKEETDWCHFEFTYASTKMKRKLIAVVMEEDMLAKSKWSGEVVGYLGKNMHIDYTSDDKLEQCCKQLASAIADKIE